MNENRATRAVLGLWTVVVLLFLFIPILIALLAFVPSTHAVGPLQADAPANIPPLSEASLTKMQWINKAMFEAYDQPNLVNTCDRRNRSTIAPQALLLMNNNLVILQAKHFAERLVKEAGGSVELQVRPLFRALLDPMALQAFVR